MGIHNFRRDVLTGGAIGLSAMLAGSAGATGRGKEGQSHGATVRIDEQRSSGNSVTIETLRTKKASTLYLLTDTFDVLVERKLSGNVRRGSHSIELRRSLTASQEITALLIERPGTLAAGDAATVSLGDADSTLTVRDQSGTGASVDISNLRTDVDASLFVFDATGREIGGSGVRFVGGTEIDSLTVPLESPLDGSQSVRVALYESNGGPIAETTAFLRVEDAGPATLTVEDQPSDGSSIDVSHLWTAVDSSLFVFDESGDVVGGSGVTFEAGEEVTDRSVDLDEPLESTQEVTVELYESNGGPIATETVTVDVGDADPATLTVEDHESDGGSVDVASLQTSVDASLFVFDESGDTVGGSGVTFDAGDEVSGLTVDLDDPLESTQDVTVKLYESNGGPIAEETATVTVSDAGTASITVDDQSSDGTAVELTSLRTPVDAALFVFDESDDVVGDASGFEAGDELESYPVELDTPLSSSQQITVTLYESNGGPIAEDEASVTLE